MGKKDGGCFPTWRRGREAARRKVFPRLMSQHPWLWMCSPTCEPPALQLCLPLPPAHSSGPASAFPAAFQSAGHPTGFPSSPQDNAVRAKSEQRYLRCSEGRKEVRRQGNIPLYTIPPLPKNTFIVLIKNSAFQLPWPRGRSTKGEMQGAVAEIFLINEKCSPSSAHPSPARHQSLYCRLMARKRQGPAAE